jgi:hypothetical protein
MLCAESGENVGEKVFLFIIYKIYFMDKLCATRIKKKKQRRTFPRGWNGYGTDVLQLILAHQTISEMHWMCIGSSGRILTEFDSQID